MLGEGFPLLTVLLVVPAVGAAFAASLSALWRTTIRMAALVATSLTFLLSLALLVDFEVGVAGFQPAFAELAEWIPEWGITYRLDVDGISLFLILLTTLFFPLAILAAWEQVERAKGFFISLLVLETALIGVFTATDLVLFYVFFEAMLVPMYALIGIWGGERRRYASLKFFLYTLVGGLAMLVGILYLYLQGGATSFDYDALAQVDLGRTEQLWLFAAFFVAFAIKVPLFPLHTWLPDAHTEAPTVGSVILAAVLLKIGGYGFLRFNLPYFPEATQALAPAILVLAVTGILYGAIVAAMQRDIKRLVAYSSVAHLGFVVLGTFALTGISASASVVQMVNHGITTGALFLLIGFLYERTHSRAIADYSGLLAAAPVFGGIFLLTAMSSIAVPSLNGFVGEFPILVGAFQRYPWAAVAAAFGVILAALYLLWAYQRMFHGPLGGHAEGLSDLTPREIAVVTPLLVLMIVIGLAPQFLYDRINPSVEQVIAQAGAGPADVAATGEAGS